MTIDEKLKDIAREFARLTASAEWITANSMLEAARAIEATLPKLPDLADIQKLIGSYRPAEQPPALRFSDLAALPPRRQSIVRRERKIGF